MGLVNAAGDKACLEAVELLPRVEHLLWPIQADGGMLVAHVTPAEELLLLSHLRRVFVAKARGAARDAHELVPIVGLPILAAGPELRGLVEDRRLRVVAARNLSVRGVEVDPAAETFTSDSSRRRLLSLLDIHSHILLESADAGSRFYRTGGGGRGRRGRRGRGGRRGLRVGARGGRGLWRGPVDE